MGAVFSSSEKKLLRACLKYERKISHDEWQAAQMAEWCMEERIRYYQNVLITPISVQLHTGQQYRCVSPERAMMKLHICADELDALRQDTFDKHTRYIAIASHYEQQKKHGFTLDCSKVLGKQSRSAYLRDASTLHIRAYRSNTSSVASSTYASSSNSCEIEEVAFHANNHPLSIPSHW